MKEIIKENTGNLMIRLPRNSVDSRINLDLIQRKIHTMSLALYQNGYDDIIPIDIIDFANKWQILRNLNLFINDLNNAHQEFYDPSFKKLISKIKIYDFFEYDENERCFRYKFDSVYILYINTGLVL